MTVQELTAAQIAPLADIVGVANTPAYLFKHFLADATVQSLSRQYSAADLLAYAQQAASTSPMTWDRMAEAYAALVAVGLRPLKEFAAAEVDHAAIGKIRWAREILDMRRVVHTTNTSSIITSSSVVPSLTAGSSPRPMTTDQSARIEVHVSKGNR
jgi:hypothetical protein